MALQARGTGGSRTWGRGRGRREGSLGPNGIWIRIRGAWGAGTGAGLGRGSWSGPQAGRARRDVGFEPRLSGLGQFFPGDGGGGERVD